MLLLLDMSVSLVGRARTERRLFVQGPQCCLWTLELLRTATSKTDSFRDKCNQLDLIFFVAPKATSSY